MTINDEEKWTPGDIVYNKKYNETAHYLTYIGHFNRYIVVLPMNGQHMGDEEWWRLEDVEWVQRLTTLRLV